MSKGRDLTLSESERHALEALTRAGSTAQQLADRARIILRLAGGDSLAEVARVLGTWPKRVAQWRNRWLGCHDATPIADRLSDAPRPGAPSIFTAEQCCTIIALACERPEDAGVPVTHWSSGDLAREATARGIVPSISPRTVGRLLKRCRPQTAFGPAVADAETRPGL